MGMFCNAFPVAAVRRKKALITFIAIMLRREEASIIFMAII